HHGSHPFHPGSDTKASFLFNIFFRIITYKALRQVHLHHHVITGVDAGGAVNAFQLGAVPDVYPGRTYINTLVAVDAVPQSKDRPVFIFPEFGTTFFSFPAFVVIGYHHRFVVQQDALQSPVGAGDGTHLFPKPCKDEKEDPGEDKDPYKGAYMFQRTFSNVIQYAFAGNEVGQEHVGDHKGDDGKEEPFEALLPDLFRIPFLFIESHLGSAIAFDPVFYLPEYHFHENGLRADPSAEDPSEGGGEYGDKHHGNDHSRNSQIEILRPERLSENIEFPACKIEKEKLVPVNVNKGSRQQDSQQEPG